MANLGNLSAIKKNAELIACISPRMSIGERNAEKRCQLSCRETKMDLNNQLQPSSTKQTVKMSIRTATLKMSNGKRKISLSGSTTKNLFISVAAAASIAKQHLSREKSGLMITGYGVLITWAVRYLVKPPSVASHARLYSWPWILPLPNIVTSLKFSTPHFSQFATYKNLLLSLALATVVFRSIVPLPLFLWNMQLLQLHRADTRGSRTEPMKRWLLLRW